MVNSIDFKPPLSIVHLKFKKYTHTRFNFVLLMKLDRKKLKKNLIEEMMKINFNFSPSYLHNINNVRKKSGELHEKLLGIKHIHD